MKAKGVSPVVATVLLIAITIVLASIIFLWARSFLEEGAQKQGKAVELSCDQIVFAASLSAAGGTTVLDVINQGNVPIYGFVFKELQEGSITPNDLTDSDVGPGASKSITLSGSPQSGLVVPILLAEESSGNRISYPCPDVSAKRVDL